MRIYITHCSAKKETSLKNTNIKVTPDKLYTATPTQRFIKKCKERNVKWALFSDLYGVWFPTIERQWYDKDPKTVTSQEFLELTKNFEKELRDYDEIFFYYNSGHFHPLYKRLLRETKINSKITLFSHLIEIS